MKKELTYLPDEIIINEEKKGLFGVKKKTLNIDIQTINQLEKVVENEKICSVNIYYGAYNIYFIENNNHDGDLNLVYENLIKYRDKNLFEVITTDLTSGYPVINVLFEKNSPNN